MEKQRPTNGMQPSLEVDSLAMVRLARIADQLSLSVQLRADLRDAVLDGVEAVVTDVRRRDVMAAAPKPRPSKVDQVKQDKYSSWTVEKLEYHIRRAVEADVKWDKIEPYAWKLYELDHTAVMAGRVVELAFLQGGLEAAIKVMDVLTKENVRYFPLVHERLKTPLIVSLWCRTELTLLEKLISLSPNEPGLMPLERYFVFWRLLHGDDPGKPIMYFQRHKVALLAAAEEYGSKVGFTKDKFLLVLGRLHLETGMEENARLLLEQISTESREYADGLDVLLKLKITKNRNGHSIYAAKLNAEVDWQKRIFMLRTFFTNCRALGSFRDANRPALNEILSDPLKWFPKTQEAWTAVSQVLAENFDLYQILPELLRVFRENSLVMHAPELDRALWSGLISSLEFRGDMGRYFSGVAKLHYFLASGSATAEEALWEAKKILSEIEENASVPFLHTWQDFHRFSYQYVAKSVYLTENNREQIIRQLKVATDPRLLAMSDISLYLEGCIAPSMEVLTNLQYIARSRMHHEIEIDIILRRARLSHLTNRDIENIWTLAIKQNDWDAAWRSISVLQERKPINKAVQQAWLISGEKRSLYPLINISKQHVLNFIDDFTKEEKKLIQACIQVGGQIPELLFLLDNHAKSSKVKQYGADTVEGKVVRFLDGMNWLPAAKKEYQYSNDGLAKSSHSMPSFMQTLPTNQWTFVFREISLRMGVTSWGWKLSSLKRSIEDIIPRLINRQDLPKGTSKVSKWMRNLTPEQRSAWHDLAKVTSEFSDEQASYVLYRFIIRLTTLVCVNHVEGLRSLYLMRVPVFIIWDFENWLLGHGYGSYRASLGIQSKVSVPRSLRNITLI